MQNDHPYPVTQAVYRSSFIGLGYRVGMIILHSAKKYPYPVTQAVYRSSFIGLGYRVGMIILHSAYCILHSASFNFHMNTAATAVHCVSTKLTVLIVVYQTDMN